MASTKNLARFTIVAADDEFQLHIEDDGGDTLELTATAEQLDLIVEALDEALSKVGAIEELGGQADEED